jgi:hypothetical protein
MNKPTTLLWLDGVLTEFIGTSTFQWPSSLTQIQQINDWLPQIKLLMQRQFPVEHVGLRIIKRLCLGTTQVELMPILFPHGIKP